MTGSRDIFAVQIESGRAIAHQIRIKLVPHEDERPPRVVDLQAYDDYLRGRYLWNQRTPKSVKESGGSVREGRRSGYGVRHGLTPALADCYAALGSQAWMSPREASVKARAAARKAVKLRRATSPKPHANLGFCLTVFEYEWAQANGNFAGPVELIQTMPLPIIGTRFIWPPWDGWRKRWKSCAERSGSTRCRG